MQNIKYLTIAWRHLALPIGVGRHREAVQPRYGQQHHFLHWDAVGQGGGKQAVQFVGTFCRLGIEISFKFLMRLFLCIFFLSQ